MTKHTGAYVSVKRACAIKTSTTIISLVNIILTVSRLTSLRGWAFYCILLFCCACFVLSVLPIGVNGAVYKTIIVLSLFTLVAIVSFILLDNSGALELLTDVESLRLFIAGFGMWGYAALFVVTVFEVVVLPIPAAVTILIGTVLYESDSVVFRQQSRNDCRVVDLLLYRNEFRYRIVSWIAGKDNADRYIGIIGKGQNAVFRNDAVASFSRRSALHARRRYQNVTIFLRVYDRFHKTRIRGVLQFFRFR
ncbi:MAG: hypothetical protein ACLUSP_01085 [Christensenellales bacterium]